MAAHQAPPSLGFFRQEHWSGLPFPSPSLTTNMNKLNSSIKSHGMTKRIKEQDPTICCLWKIHFSLKDTGRLSMKGWKKTFQADIQFSSPLSCFQLFATSWTAAWQASLSITNSLSLLKFMSIKLVIPSNHLIFCHTLLLPHSIFPSIRIFSNESALHIRWPKYWSLSFSISPFNEYSGLISFRIDWFDLLAV